MRFNRRQRYPFTWSRRKEAAYHAKCRREREALPLFADQISEEQLDVETVREQREAQWTQREADVRKEQAEQWRKARKALREHPDRDWLERAWNAHRWLPARPEYLADFVSHDGYRKDE